MEYDFGSYEEAKGKYDKLSVPARLVYYGGEQRFSVLEEKGGVLSAINILKKLREVQDKSSDPDVVSGISDVILMIQESKQIIRY